MHTDVLAYARTANGPIGAPSSSLYLKLGFSPQCFWTSASKESPKDDDSPGGNLEDILDDVRGCSVVNRCSAVTVVGEGVEDSSDSEDTRTAQEYPMTPRDMHEK